MIVGIEVGGTFTDLIAIQDDGRTVIHKTPSTPDDPSRAAVIGLRELLARISAGGGDVSELLHGSTIAANALIQRRGAKLALLATQGFRDLLFIQRQDKSVVYDMFYQKPVPLVTRDMVFEVPERLAASGAVVTPLDEVATDALIERIVEQEGAEAIAVCLLHAYANNSHEQAIKRQIKARYPDVYVALSSDIAPEHREYERTSTTVISAFVGPSVDSYLSRFESATRDLSIDQTPLIMLSNGGVAPVAAARHLAANMFLSGPAAAVTGAAAIAKSIGTPNIISIDVGGTSSDVCLITNGTPETTVKGTSEFNVDGLPINIVMTDIVSIGAGGGSIAWIDPGGMLQVGPQSSGATPGPACYGLGGENFCLTDAMLLLGLLDPAIRLPGDLKLDVNRSKDMAQPLADSLGLSAFDIAERVFRIAVANMAQALRRVSVKRGHDPRDYALFACGGAGPLIATALADEMGMEDVIVPPNPGVFSAVGLALSDIRIDYVLAEGARRARELTPAELSRNLEELRTRARTAFINLGYAVEDLRFDFSVDARYRGQGYELRLNANSEKLETEGASYLAALFHEEHARQYGHAFEDRDVEVISIRLSAVYPRAVGIADLSGKNNSTGAPQRQIRLTGEAQLYSAVARDTLAMEAVKAGPAVIVEASSTTIVPPGWQIAVVQGGVLRLQKAGA